MRKISYNLAVTRKIDGRSFVLRASILVLAIMALGGATIFNLAREHGRSRAEKSASGLIERQIVEKKSLGLLQAREITAWKKKWGKELAATNRLIERKSFSFITRLDFLEEACGPGIRIRHLIMTNDGSGQISMSIAAQSLKQLFALYKKLAPYGLAIANETQTAAEFQVNLGFNISNEKI